MDAAWREEWMVRYKRTKQLIEGILRGPNRYGDMAWRAAAVEVHYGDAWAGAYRNSFGWHWTLKVLPGWLEAVHGEGISLVDGVLVLYAQGTPNKVECDASWLASVVVPEIRAGGFIDVKVALTRIVRWQGQVHCGKDQEEALRLCHQDYTNALVGGDE